MSFPRDLVEKLICWTKVKIRLHQKDEKELYFREREVWWASVGMNIGYEENGKNESFERPVLIVKKFGRHSFWAVPLSSKEKEGKYYCTVELNRKKQTVLLTQLKLFSSKRLIRKISKLPANEFIGVRSRLREFL